MAKKITNSIANQSTGNAPVADTNQYKIANTDKDNIEDTSSGIPTVTAKDLENDKWENINMPVYIKPVNTGDNTKYHFTDPNKKAAATGADELEEENSNNYSPMQKTVFANNPATAKGVNDDALKPKPLTFSDFANALSRQSQSTPEDEAKLRKRQTAMTMLGALSDGIAGMANIFAANKGALPVKHDPVTRELDAKYQDILNRRRANRDRWDNIRLQAGMTDLSQRLQDAREQRMLAAKQKATEIEYARELQKLGITHEQAKELLRQKQGFEDYQTDKKFGHDMQLTEYKEGQQNKRTAATNATSVENNIRTINGKNNDKGGMLSFGGNNLNIDKKILPSLLGKVANEARIIRVKTIDKNGKNTNVPLNSYLGIDTNKDLSLQDAQRILTYIDKNARAISGDAKLNISRALESVVYNNGGNQITTNTNPSGGTKLGLK